MKRLTCVVTGLTLGLSLGVASAEECTNEV